MEGSEWVQCGVGRVVSGYSVGVGRVMSGYSVGVGCGYLVFCFKSFSSVVVHVLYMRPEAGQTNRVQPVQHCVCVCV